MPYGHQKALGIFLRGVSNTLSRRFRTLTKVRVYLTRQRIVVELSLPLKYHKGWKEVGSATVDFCLAASPFPQDTHSQLSTDYITQLHQQSSCSIPLQVHLTWPGEERQALSKVWSNSSLLRHLAPWQDALLSGGVLASTHIPRDCEGSNWMCL